MKFFRVMLRAEGISLPVQDAEDHEALKGYYASWMTRGRSRGAAEYRAIALEWDSWVAEGYAALDRGELRLSLEDSCEVSWSAYARRRVRDQLQRRGMGRTFWSEDS